MASDQSFVDYVCDQINAAGSITFKKMFGEYAIYCDSKIVALICDNQLFVKPTTIGREMIGAFGESGNVVEAPPYPGAKPSFLIDSQLDDQAWMASLIRSSAAELPLPKPRKKKSKKESA